MPPARPSSSARASTPATVWAEAWPWLLGTLALWLGLTFGASLARVSGDSMNPTLHSGDWLLLVKYPRWLDPQAFPRRGSVVVFRGPPGSPYSYEDHQLLGLEWRTRPVHIKRAVAVPGDRIELRGGQVWVNGQALAESYAVGGDAGSQSPRTLSPGELWVMGDNRQVGSSLDSRAYGPVLTQDVLGEVPLRLWPSGGRLP